MLHIDLAELIKTVSYIGLFVIVFAESGLLIGILLPGDSLLFTAGFLVSERYLEVTSQSWINLAFLIVVCVTAAITGDAAGYLFGRRVGRRLYDRPDSRWFKRHHLERAEAFYEQHGGKTIVIARFMPFVRTLAPVVAGISDMQYRRFVLFNAAGGILWGAGMPIAGYLLGSAIPDVDRYLLPIVAVIIVISALPSIIHIVAANRGEIMARVRGRRELPSSTLPKEGRGDR